MALAGACGCGVRERRNPFDPRNPGTRGSPVGFAALAGDGRVDLRWEPVSGRGLLGFRLYRRTAAETEFRALSDVLPPATSRYADRGLLNGLEHVYRLFYVFDEGDRDPPAQDVATPGLARPWVVDSELGMLFRITPDGRRIAFQQGGLGGPVAVGVDSVSGLVWVSDAFGGRVAVLDPLTGVQVIVPGLVSPSALAVEPRNGSAYVCDERGGVLHQFDSRGGPLGFPIELLDLPIGVAIERGDRSVWICERGASRLRRYRPDRTLIWAIPVDRPSRVAVDSLTGRGWVTSFESGQLFRIAPSGAIERTIEGLLGPIGVAVDSKRGRIWVADARAGEVLALDRSGAVEFRIAGLPEVRDVSVDEASGEAWAAVPGAGEIARLSGAGQVIRRLGGFGQPLGVAVDPGTRR